MILFVIVASGIYASTVNVFDDDSMIVDDVAFTGPLFFISLLIMIVIYCRLHNHGTSV